MGEEEERKEEEAEDEMVELKASLVRIRRQMGTPWAKDDKRQLLVDVTGRRSDCNRFRTCMRN